MLVCVSLALDNIYHFSVAYFKVAKKFKKNAILYTDKNMFMEVEKKLHGDH